MVSLRVKQATAFNRSTVPTTSSQGHSEPNGIASSRVPAARVAGFFIPVCAGPAGRHDALTPLANFYPPHYKAPLPSGTS